MTKISKLTPKEAYDMWKYLMVAGDNILYAVHSLWETYQKELTAFGREHYPGFLEEEMEILRSEFNYHRSMIVHDAAAPSKQ